MFTSSSIATLRKVLAGNAVSSCHARSRFVHGSAIARASMLDHLFGRSSDVQSADAKADVVSDRESADATRAASLGNPESAEHPGTAAGGHHVNNTVGSKHSAEAMDMALLRSRGEVSQENDARFHPGPEPE